MGWMDEIKAEFVKTFIRDDRYKVFLTGFENTILITDGEPEIFTLTESEIATGRWNQYLGRQTEA